MNNVLSPTIKKLINKLSRVAIGKINIIMASEYVISTSPKEDYEKYYSYLDPFVTMNKAIFIWILIGTCAMRFIPLIPLYWNETYYNCTNPILKEDSEYLYTFIIMLFGYALLGNIDIGRDNMDVKLRKLMNLICFAFNFYIWAYIIRDMVICVVMWERGTFGLLGQSSVSPFGGTEDCMIMDFLKFYGLCFHFSTLISINTILCYHRCVIMFESQKEKPTEEIP